MEKDTLITCPYDKSHRIRAYKLMTHLTKCKRQNNNKNKRICPLNSTHIVDFDELEEHLKKCPNLESMSQGYVKNKTEASYNVYSDNYVSTENWDEAPEVPTYNPMANTQNRNVIRSVSGLSKSERKKFRLEERARLENLNGVNKNYSSKDAWNEQPLRPPSTVQQFLYEMETSEHNTRCRDFARNNVSAETKSLTTHEFRHKILERLYENCVNELTSNYTHDTYQEANASVSDNHEPMKSDYHKMNDILMKKIMELDLSNNDSVTYT